MGNAWLANKVLCRCTEKNMMKDVKEVKKIKTRTPLEISVRKAGSYISDFLLQMLICFAVSVCSIQKIKDISQLERKSKLKPTSLKRYIE